MQGKQVFQTDSKTRWHSFTWFFRILAVVYITLIVVGIYSLLVHWHPSLPALLDKEEKYKRILNPDHPLSFTTSENKRYQGFRDVLANPNYKHAAEKSDTLIRAAFYVDWDPQSLFSLQSYANRLNTVLPEWFFLTENGDSIQLQIDEDALAVMRQNHLKVLPMLTNASEQEFSQAAVKKLLASHRNQTRVIAQLVSALNKYKFDGINIDLENLPPGSERQLVEFVKELHAQLARAGMLITQDIAADAHMPVQDLAPYCNYLFVMAYDEHYGTSQPGPVSEQRYVEKSIDEIAKAIPGNKLVLCLAGYGYDWPENAEAATLTYQQAIELAREHRSAIVFNNDTYDCSFTYTDDAGTDHEVHFNDACTLYNTVRFADEYGTAGTALWRLGSEDTRMWAYYNIPLNNATAKSNAKPYEWLENGTLLGEKPDYLGDGEVLDVLATPSEGHFAIETDSIGKLVTEERYLSLPSKYVLRRFGNLHNQVILTFDDGPDAIYTPKILNILKKEHVPASFFIVGENAERNIPLLHSIAAAGHEIGNHTFTHPNIARISPRMAKLEIESTRLLIESVTGRSTILFRPPFNADALPTTHEELEPLAIARQANYYFVGESIDPNDWDPGITADTIVQRVIKQYEDHPEKGIILLHDAGGETRQATVDALPKIIAYFKKKGVGFTTVGKLLNKTPDEVMPPLPARSRTIMQINYTLASAAYFTMKWITRLFWLAIVLGIGRIVFMSVLATRQYFISKKEEAKLDAAPAVTAPVTIVIPAYNEEVNCLSTIESLLKQDYVNIKIVFVDDGSADHTYEKAKAAYGLHPAVSIFTKPNGGKASALNFGILQANTEYVVCIDADTQLKPDAVSQLMKYFYDEHGNALPDVGAVAGYVSVGNTVNLLTRWQSLEYITAQNFDRRAFDLINGITVVPGAIGAFNRQAVLDCGSLDTDTLAEDCDLTIKLLRNGYKVRNAGRAIAVTEAPETVQQFLKQRFRWSYGIMQSCWKHKKAFFNPSVPGLGWVALPNVLIFQLLLPMLAPLADLMFLIGMLFNDAAGRMHILLYYSIFLVVDLLVAAMAYLYDKKPLEQIGWIIPQRFYYRQLMYIVLFRAIRKAIKGEGQGWGQLKRTGNVQLAGNA